GLDLDLDLDLQGAEPAPATQAAENTLSAQVEAFERSLICTELGRGHGSLRSLAEALGIPRKTLHDKLRKHGLNFADAGANPPEQYE
ncbi:MAG TPA: helix-turn-helix domain-containing protein, partial [Pseudomonas sp.]|nr:helix-turn-helix domain-containing protein [Pseudomonas sp.]